MRDVRSRWWPIPGVLAILGSLGVVAMTQGWWNAAPVALPPVVQVGAHPDAPAATTPSSVPGPQGTVVPPSRPVISDPPAALVSSGSAGPSSTPEGAPQSGGESDPSQPVVTTGSPQATASVPAESVTTTTSTPTTTTTSTPPPVTTTTRPGDDGGGDA